MAAFFCAVFVYAEPRNISATDIAFRVYTGAGVMKRLTGEQKQRPEGGKKTGGNENEDGKGTEP